jgi:hypothetical protein
MDNPPSYTPIWGLNEHVLFIYLILNEEKCPCFENIFKKFKGQTKLGSCTIPMSKCKNQKV